MKKICNNIALYVITNERGGYIMKTNYAPQPSYVKVTEYKRQSSVDDYSEYFDWLHSSLKQDNQIVLREKLHFLQKVYEELLCRLEKELSIEKYWRLLLSIDKNEKNKNKLKKYIHNTKDIYNGINGFEIHSDFYNHYDNLSSWYSAQIDSTNRVLDKLSKSSCRNQYNKNTMEHVCYTVINGNYQVIIYGNTKLNDK